MSRFPFFIFSLFLCVSLGALGSRPIDKSAGKVLDNQDVKQAIGLILERAHKARLKKRRKKMQRIMAAFLLLGRHTIIPDNCMLESGVNPLYLIPDYYQNFSADKKHYDTVIIGDSTMAINAFVKGWLNPAKTQTVAVPGNKLCHMLITLERSINSPAPKTIIVSTLGGNDLLSGRSPEFVQALGELLFRKLRARFPGARIVGEGIHPTRVAQANKRKDRANAAMEIFWLKDKNSCWVDPLPAFGLKPGQAARPAQMFPDDTIHYAPAITRGLKQLIVKTCGVNF